jgi:hypothetical protein
MQSQKDTSKNILARLKMRIRGARRRSIMAFKLASKRYLNFNDKSTKSLTAANQAISRQLLLQSSLDPPISRVARDGN